MSNILKQIYTKAKEEAKKDNIVLSYMHITRELYSLKSQIDSTISNMHNSIDALSTTLDENIKSLPSMISSFMVWANIIDKPTRFPPIEHRHTVDDIVDMPDPYQLEQHSIVDYHTVPFTSDKEVPITDNGILQLRRLSIDDINQLSEELDTIKKYRGGTYYYSRGSGSGGGSGGSSTLSGLTDTSIVLPTEGQSLIYDADTEKWVNGDSGTFSIDSGDTFPIAPSEGDYFFNTTLGLLAYYDGVSWQYFTLPDTVMLTTTYDTDSSGVIDTAALPTVSSTSSGIVPDTSGANEGDIASVSSDGTLEYVTPIVPTSIGNNLLINGSFSVWQRGASHTSVSEFDYTVDRWYVLYQSAAINVSRQTGNTQPYCIRLTQPNATSQRIGIAQIIEGVNCKQVRGDKISISGNVKLSVSGNVRYAVLAWSGTEDGDSATSPSPHFSDTAKDIVNSWTSSTYTAGNFFKSSNLDVVLTGNIACDGSTYSSFSDTSTGNVPNDMNNLIVFIWSEDAIAQNATLDIEAIQVEKGDTPNIFQQRSIGEELALCQRYCYAKYADTYTRLSFGMGISSDNSIVIMSLSGVLRTEPIMTTSPGMFQFYSTTSIIPTGLIVYKLYANVLTLYGTKTGSFTNGTMYQLRTGGTAGLVEFTSEL